MRINLQMLYTKSWDELAALTSKNIIQYCNRHEYTWSIKCIPEPYDGFRKVEHIQSVFKNHSAEVVLSLDCDLLITNLNTRVEDFLEETKDAYLTHDYNGLNAGVFIIKKSMWSDCLLKYLLEQRGKDKMYCEQNGFEAYMKEFPNDEKIKILPHPSINSYLYENYPDIPPQTHEQGQFEKGDFVLHLPGIGLEKRIEIFKQMKEQIIL